MKEELLKQRKKNSTNEQPQSSHDVELIYMCKGNIKHMIYGEVIDLKQGEILLLNQKAVQELPPTKEDHTEICFFIPIEFLDEYLMRLQEEENLIRDFIIRCLKGTEEHINYLHFAVSEVLPIQNLMENLLWSMQNEHANNQSMYQMTMGLLLLQLMNHTDKVHIGKDNQEQELLMVVFHYIDEQYKSGELSELARMLHYDLHWLSRMIKRMTGKTYTDLVQEKRMSRAVYLLMTTKLTINEIAVAVGYENVSYFHRLFSKTYGQSPRAYRMKHR